MASQRFICKTCGFIYDQALGDVDSGLAPGTAFADIPDDWQCPLCGVRKSDFMSLEAYAAEQQAQQQGQIPRLRRASGKAGGEDTTVILGSGVAGWQVAAQLRAYDPKRTIHLLTADQGVPYRKPALSTALRQGQAPEALIDGSAEMQAEKYQVQLYTNTRVMALKAKEKRLMTAKGAVPYGQLVLALGAQQRRLAVAGDAADSIIRINDLASYRLFRERLTSDQPADYQVLIVGSGLIGVELAEDLTAAGYSVMLVDRSAQPLSNLLPSELSLHFKQYLQEKGIEFLGETTLTVLHSHQDAYLAELSSGQQIKVNLVISALGLLPNIDLAKKAGLMVGRGIQVQSQDLRTSDAHIFALGDCAEVEGVVYQYIEPILRQAETIAASLCGQVLPFVAKPLQIRVKTSQLPLLIQLPHRQADGEWQWTFCQEQAWRMDFMVNGASQGFAQLGRLPTMSDSTA